MTQYFAFLRGINLGKRRLKMETLKSILEKIGFDNVSTFIASGNVIFESTVKDAAKLEAQIENKLEAELGYDVETHLRTAAEVAAIARLDPFPKQPWIKSGWTVHVGFHKENIPKADAKKLCAIATDYDAFHIAGRELYWLTHGGVSTSTVWKLPEVKQIKLASSTMRNRKTILNLVEKYELDK